MPRAGSGLSSTGSRSPILLLLTLALISFLAISPLYYLSTSDSNTLVAQRDGDQGSGQEVEASWMVQEGDQVEDDSFNLIPPPIIQQAVPLHPSTKSSSRWTTIASNTVDTVGDLVLALFGFDETDWFEDSSTFDGGEEEESQLREMGIEGTSLTSWSESSVYVERTQSLHPSRPSAFGPHLLNSPLRGNLYPIQLFSNDSYGCSPSSSSTSVTRDKSWIALVQRGQCPFSDKVRISQGLGAKAVVFGDEDEIRGGIRGGKGLLTPWSPDDTSDVKIPSIFVSRASYLSLERTWEDEQSIGGGDSASQEYVGLEVVLSKDEMFAWPLLDLLFLLLFLPSLLTLLTVFTQRVRLARLAKAERAPKSAVAKLVVFKWGEPAVEKTNVGITGTSQEAVDEEREIGLNATRNGTEDDQEEEATNVDESTSLLLTPHPPSPSPPTPSSTLLTRLRRLVRLPSHRSTSPISLSPNNNSSHLPTRGASILYPSLTDCTICLEPFVVNESIVIELPCKHLFHRDCCVDWLVMRKGVCPICRRSVMEEEDGDVGGERTTEEVRIQLGEQDGEERGEGRVV